MILQALVKYYEDLERQEKLPKQGWCQAKVSYGINLSTDGDIKNILWLKEERQTGKKQIWISQTMKVPAMLTRSSGVAANFLCDNSKYMLGIDKSGTGKRITECFEAAKEKHLKLLKNTSGEMAQAICAFFYKWNPEKAKENAAVLENWEEITDGGNLIFCMDKKYAQDDKEIEQIWNVESKQSETDISGICLVTGEKTEISRIHRNIKGVPGAQSSGAALVSFNAPSFESYGKEQSYNAPVGKYAEFAYTSALNYLLAQKKYTFPLGDSIIVYWAEEAKTEYQDALLALLNPVKDNQSEVHGFFEKLRKDEQIIIDDIELNPSQKFYILCLAPNAARLSVRFFYQSSFGNITKMLSFVYTLLTNTIASSLECVGLDPYVGYLHTERPGRVSLALDMIEELRAVLADRFVLSLVNKKIVNGKNFTKKENGAVLMDDELRKKLLVEWQKKKKETITHPFLKEKVEWGMVPYVQAMLLARYLRGDLDSYPVFLWK